MQFNCNSIRKSVKCLHPFLKSLPERKKTIGLDNLKKIMNFLNYMFVWYW